MPSQMQLEIRLLVVFRVHQLTVKIDLHILKAENPNDMLQGLQGPVLLCYKERMLLLSCPVLTCPLLSV